MSRYLFAKLINEEIKDGMKLLADHLLQLEFMNWHQDVLLETKGWLVDSLEYLNVLGQRVSGITCRGVSYDIIEKFFNPGGNLTYLSCGSHDSSSDPDLEKRSFDEYTLSEDERMKKDERRYMKRLEGQVIPENFRLKSRLKGYLEFLKNLYISRPVIHLMESSICIKSSDSKREGNSWGYLESLEGEEEIIVWNNFRHYWGFRKSLINKQLVNHDDQTMIKMGLEVGSIFLPLCRLMIEKKELEMPDFDFDLDSSLLFISSDRMKQQF